MKMKIGAAHLKMKIYQTSQSRKFTHHAIVNYFARKFLIVNIGRMTEALNGVGLKRILGTKPMKMQLHRDGKVLWFYHLMFMNTYIIIGIKYRIQICLNEDTLTYQHTCIILDCGFGEIQVERTQGCNSDRYTCMKGFDVNTCCGGKNAETRKCVPCDETALSRPDPSYEYTTLNECEYKKIPGISEKHFKYYKAWK
jgi:hypothetical protein